MSGTSDKKDTVATTELLESADLSLHNPLSMLSKDFTLVSCEGKEITMPVYDLMGWSTFFRDLLQSSNGKLRIELPERAETIDQFRQLINSRPLGWRKSGVPLFTQVFDLLDFLDKYDCSRAIDELVKLLLLGISENASTGRLPPLILFAVGARLDQVELCAAALDAPKRSWKSYSSWTRPAGISGVEHISTLHPDGIPYQLLTTMSFDYVLTLSRVPVKQGLFKGIDARKMGDEFVRQLENIRQHAKRA